MLVRVALPLPLDEAFTYAVPEGLEDGLVPGSRVVVPFGKRILTGVVVETLDEESEPGDGLRFVDDVLDDGAAATPELLRLTRWVADYYVCSHGEALRAALPAGLDVATEHRVRATGAEPGRAFEDPRLGPVLHTLLGHPSLTFTALRQRLPHVTLALVQRLERLGLVEIETGEAAPKITPKTETALRLAPAFQEASALRDARQLVRGAKQKAVLDALLALAQAGTPEPSQPAVLARAAASAGSVASLVEAGIVERFTREVRRGGLEGEAIVTEPPRVLHAHQRTAFARIAAQIRAGTYSTFLLHGVTGSGKTEVYVAALREALDAGRTGLVLVPEIALTPQTVRRFRAPFGDKVAVVHSRMSNGERYDVWRSIHEGRYPVVIGPRSAIFAPVHNLGLVVVDEEHEASYKQFDPAPRYHARDVAVVRARLNGAVCVLGSATPSLESWHNAHAGKYHLLGMPERVPLPGGATAKLPPVQVVDLARERKRHRLDGALSEALTAAIADRIAKQEGVILLQNRRGYAPVVECRACGYSPRCQHCAVTLTYHKPKAHLRCHYCGYSIRRPHTCPSCGDPDLAFQGIGTQRVEEELHQRFPGIRVVRMDLDTTGTKGAHARLLDQFARGEADVLLGTQMVAKGLDFARVTLVGVVNADAGLLLPDFRAAERTFQLLTQVAGRAGRAEAPGAVILQTRTPDNPALTYAQRHDFEGFARREMQEREMLGYPPYGRVVAAEFRGYAEDGTLAFAKEWTAALLEAVAGLPVEVLGPQPALVGRVQRLYRVHTILKALPGAPPLQPILRRVMAACPAPNRMRVALDVDAVSVF